MLSSKFFTKKKKVNPEIRNSQIIDTSRVLLYRSRIRSTEANCDE